MIESSPYVHQVLLVSLWGQVGPLPTGPMKIDIASVPACSVPTCSAKFKLLWRKRQRCPACLKAVCGACCGEKAVAHWNGPPEPVCSECRHIIGRAALLQVRCEIVCGGNSEAKLLVADVMGCDWYVDVVVRFRDMQLASPQWGIPKAPAVTLIDSSQIVVRIADAAAPWLLAVKGVELQQELDPMATFAPTAIEIKLAPVAGSERLRLRWVKDGEGSAWSEWVSEPLTLFSNCWQSHVIETP